MTQRVLVRIESYGPRYENVSAAELEYGTESEYETDCDCSCDECMKGNHLNCQLGLCWPS